MGARCFGEFVGTAVLILLGDGVVANVLLKRSKAEGAGWLAIAAGLVLHSPWCLACSRQSLAAVRMVISTRHSRSAWRSRREIFRSSGRSWWHRCRARIVGAVLVWVHFLPHWRQIEDADVKLLCFSTMPAIRNLGANFLSEVIGTFVLVVAAAAIFSKRVTMSGPAADLGPYLVGVLV